MLGITIIVTKSATAGDGDYGSNADSYQYPIEYREYDPNTGQQIGESIRMNNKAIDEIRRFNGSMWVPQIDPSAVRGYNNQAGGGVWTNSGGTWHLVDAKIGFKHVFDVAVLPDGTIFMGGSTEEGAVIAKGKDDGNKFEIVWLNKAPVADGELWLPRVYAMHLSADKKKLYFITGHSGITGTWAYDIAKNSASKINDYGGTCRMDIMSDGTVIAGNGYIFGYSFASNNIVNVGKKKYSRFSGVSSYTIGSDGALYYTTNRPIDGKRYVVIRRAERFGTASDYAMYETDSWSFPSTFHVAFGNVYVGALGEVKIYGIK